MKRTKTAAKAMQVSMGNLCGVIVIRVIERPSSVIFSGRKNNDNSTHVFHGSECVGWAGPISPKKP